MDADGRLMKRKMEEKENIGKMEKRVRREDESIDVFKSESIYLITYKRN
jgi:hypothetical protein